MLETRSEVDRFDDRVSPQAIASVIVGSTFGVLFWIGVFLIVT